MCGNIQKAFLAVFAVLMIITAAPGISGGETPKPVLIDVTQDARINASIENRSLQEALMMMAEKRLLEIRGAIPAGEPITVYFSNLTLKEALKKIMRGYNYVLMDQGASGRPSLMIMGKVQAGKGTDRPETFRPASRTPIPDRADSGNQVLEPGTYYVPPSTLPVDAPSQPRHPGLPDKKQQGQTPTEQQGSEKQNTTDKPAPGPSAPVPERAPTPKESQPETQQPDGQLEAEPKRASGVSSRDLLGRTHGSFQ